MSDHASQQALGVVRGLDMAIAIVGEAWMWDSHAVLDALKDLRKYARRECDRTMTESFQKRMVEEKAKA